MTMYLLKYGQTMPRSVGRRVRGWNRQGGDVLPVLGYGWAIFRTNGALDRVRRVGSGYHSCQFYIINISSDHEVRQLADALQH